MDRCAEVGRVVNPDPHSGNVNSSPFHREKWTLGSRKKEREAGETGETGQGAEPSPFLN